MSSSSFLLSARFGNFLIFWVLVSRSSFVIWAAGPSGPRIVGPGVPMGVPPTPLLFSKSTVFQFTVGISMPVAKHPRGGLAFSSGFQFNYMLPWNLTELRPGFTDPNSTTTSSTTMTTTPMTTTPGMTTTMVDEMEQNEDMTTQPNPLAQMVDTLENEVSESGRGLSLVGVYAAIENALERYGWGDGRACLLRAICELAAVPLERGHGDDVLEEIVHLLFTPSEESTSSPLDPIKDVYGHAEMIGRSISSSSSSSSQNTHRCVELFGAGCTTSLLGHFTAQLFY